MKILVITRNAWDDTNSIGNTISNFFCSLETAEFANIYFRSPYPDNNICKNYYRTTETEIIKKWFAPETIGKQFFFDGKKIEKNTKSAGENEKKIIGVIHKYGLKVAYKISDSIWESKRWINENFENFVKSFAPDMIFSFAKSAPQYFLTIKYLKENFNIPLFTWVADDEYTVLLKNNRKKEIKRLEYIIKKSDYICGCSKEICDYYNSIFNCSAVPLYKSCELSGEVKMHTNNPIEIVYAGNLLYGRLDIIKKVAETVEKYNFDGNKVRFEIYSNSGLLPEEQKYFLDKNGSEYMGRRDYEAIKKRLSVADIVLHVESFEEEQIIKTKYSFSTKIIDCLQSGSVLLGIGPKEISSIKYIKTIPGAFVIDDLTCLDKEIQNFLSDSESFPNKATMIREFAKKHHDSFKNNEKIKEAINKIVGES